MFLLASDSSSWYTDPHQLKGLLRLIAYPVAFASAAIAAWWHRRTQKIALEWPSIEGCVQFVSVAPITDSSSYSATLEYSYFVEEYRSGSYSQEFPSEEEANNFAQGMKDKRIPIHYNPRDPDKSVLEDEDVDGLAQPTSPLGLTVTTASNSPAKFAEKA
jgi:hypothetical protein